MTDRKKPSTPDQDLVEAIKDIAVENEGDGHDVNALYSFCDLLASSPPTANEIFQRQLEDRLVSSLVERRHAAHKVDVEQRNPSLWLRHLLGQARAFIFSRSPGQSWAVKQLVSALGVAAVLVVVAVLWLRAASPVSAQQILERVQQAQSRAMFVSGIRHLRIQWYSTWPDQAETTTIAENYYDPQTRNVRFVEYDSATGQVVWAMAHDEMYVYWGWRDQSSEPGDLLTIYREPRARSIATDLVPQGVTADESLWVEAMRRDPSVEFDQATWPDGRQVYALRSQSVDLMTGGPRDEESMGDVFVLVVDAKSYQLLEYRTLILRDGQEVVVSSSRYLVDEVLPAGSEVAWDLSDLQGVQIQETAPPEAMGQQAEIISRQELSSRTQTAYVLRSIPSGFREEISAYPQPTDEPFYYIVAYGNAAGDYVALEPWPGARRLAELMDETYVTASGLKLSFLPESLPDLAGKPFTQASVQTPDGVFFLLKSSLPRDQVRVLAEDLMPVR